MLLHVLNYYNLLICTYRALEVAQKFMIFKSYVHLQVYSCTHCYKMKNNFLFLKVFIHDFKLLASQGETNSSESNDSLSKLQGLLRISELGENDLMSADMHKLVLHLGHACIVITIINYFMLELLRVDWIRSGGAAYQLQ